MATKTISITEEAYGILKSRKDESESFSEIIVKLVGRKPLASFAGVLSKSTLDEMKNEGIKIRALHYSKHRKRIEHDFR